MALSHFHVLLATNTKIFVGNNFCELILTSEKCKNFAPHEINQLCGIWGMSAQGFWLLKMTTNADKAPS